MYANCCSLVSNTVGGTFASFDKVTGAMGNTLAQLSLDPTYQRDRARQRLIAGDTMKDSMAQVLITIALLYYYNTMYTII
jgi:hypothetical protein